VGCGKLYSENFGFSLHKTVGRKHPRGPQGSVKIPIRYSKGHENMQNFAASVYRSDNFWSLLLTADIIIIIIIVVIIIADSSGRAV
jgi:hypothetical protein